MIKSKKSIAQLAITNWIKLHFGLSNMDIKFTDKHEAYVTDKNGESMTLIYDGITKRVYYAF